MARLSSFIRQNMEPILDEWESFARSLPQGENMDVAGLRDHAKDMLGVIANDLDDPQTPKQQSDKARGASDAGEDIIPTAAQEHGAGRAESGFTVGQMVAEFRALRASVMRLWSYNAKNARSEDLVDITRFNEAIDQAIAESITRYTHEIGQSKERFLAILGHDLQTPVGAIVTSTRFILDTAADAGDLPHTYQSLIEGALRSARRMNRLVADLLEFARVSFGEAMTVQRVATDLGRLVTDVVAEVRASFPDREFVCETSGLLRGEWDADRLFQALVNLLSNAVQHGSADSPIRVTARGEGDEVVLSVHNDGPVIPPEQLARMSQGMNPGTSNDDSDRRHLGLGLYIVEKIVAAHGGRMQLASNADEGTTFVLRLPRADRTVQ
ncbi:MAG TPA: sensor histidine kinase [Gemmatimonadaceae bacterium]